MAAQADRPNAMTTRTAIELRARNMSSLPSKKRPSLASSVAKGTLTVQEKVGAGSTKFITGGIAFPPLSDGKGRYERSSVWWAIQVLNLWPLACEASALPRSEEHTSELQSQSNLVCRLLLEKKNTH